MLNSAPHFRDWLLLRRMTLAARSSAGQSPRHASLRMALVAGTLYALTAPLGVSAQEAVMSTSVASPGSVNATSRITLNTLTPKPSTDGSLALPSVSLIDNGSGPRVTSLTLELPKVELGAISIGSRVGDQRLPAVFRAGALAGPALASPARGVSLTTSGSAPLTLLFEEMPARNTRTAPASAGIAAAAVSFTPNSRVFATPQVVIPIGSPDARTSIGTAVQAQIVENVSLATDLGMAGTADTSWAPLASARLVGQWPRAGIETSVLRGAAAPPTARNAALVSSRDRESAQVHVQPLPGLTLATLASVSRPSSDPVADDTTLESLRIAYDGLDSGQVAAVQQREATASRQTDITSLEWRQRGPSQMTVRYVRESGSDSMLAEGNTSTSRVEVDLPVLTPRSAGYLDLRAELAAGSLSPTNSGVSSTVSGRVALLENAAFTGETELGLTGKGGQVLRGLRVTTEIAVIPAIRLQFSYAYATATEFPVGQVFEARLVRRVSLGW